MRITKSYTKNNQSPSNNNENKQKDGNWSKKISFTSVQPNNDGNGDIIDEEDDANDDEDNDEDDARGSSVDNETELEDDDEEHTSSNGAVGIGDQENNLRHLSMTYTNSIRPSKDLKLPSLQTLDDLKYHDDLDEEKAYEDLCYVTFKSEVNNEILHLLR